MGVVPSVSEESGDGEIVAVDTSSEEDPLECAVSWSERPFPLADPFCSCLQGATKVNGKRTPPSRVVKEKPA